MEVENPAPPEAGDNPCPSVKDGISATADKLLECPGCGKTITIYNRSAVADSLCGYCLPPVAGLE